jgi:hypothetical protein
LKDGLTLTIDQKRFKEHPGRARFSIAHEIGHLILLRALGPSAIEHAERSAQSYREAEDLCDLAASHLLLPRAALSKAMRSNGLSSAGIKGICKAFDVSQMAALRAVADLLPDGAGLDWRKYGRTPVELPAWRLWQTLAPLERPEARPWLTRGSTTKKILLPFSLDTLSVDEPRAVYGVTLMRGKRLSRHDGIVVRWPSRSLSRQLAFDNQDRISARRFEGFVFMLLGAVGKSDLSIFGKL